MIVFWHSLEAVGYDLSYYEKVPSQSSFDCLYKNGYRFAILQAQIGSQFVTTSIDQYKKAKQSGIKYIDFYIFPTTKKDPIIQVKDTITKLKQANVLEGNMVWLAIQSHALYYSKCQDNINYVKQLLQGLDEAIGKSRVGLYSSSASWEQIMCGSQEFSSYQIWYPHNDNKQSFTDFEPFGGFTKPSIKQFATDQNICSIKGIDRDYYGQ